MTKTTEDLNNITQPHMDSKDFWAQAYAVLPPALDLPLDFQRPSNRSFLRTTCNHQFSPHFVNSLEKFAFDQKADLSTLAYTIFSTMIYRFSQQDDIVIGWITDLGKCVPVRLQPSKSFTAHHFYEHAHERLNDTLSQPQHDIQDVLTVLNYEDDPARAGLVEVALAWDAAGRSDQSVDSSDFDIYFSLEYKEGQLGASITCNGTLFSTETMKSWAETFELIGEAICTQMWSEPLKTLPIITEEAKQKVLYTWNQTEVNYPADSLIDKMFEAQALKTPHATAMISGQAEVTFDELNQKANQLAHYLVKRGVEPGSPVGISLPRSTDMISCLLGVLKAGCYYVALDPNYPNERLKFMISNSKIETLVSTAEIAGELLDGAETDPMVVGIYQDKDVIQAMSTDNPTIQLPPASPLYILYTSGSTGVPKGVVGHHRSAVNRLNWMWREYPFAEGEIYPQKTTLNFVDSIWEIWGPLLQGVPLLLIPNEIIGDPKQFIPLLRDYKVHRLIMVPSILKILLDDFDDLGEQLPHLKYMTFSGEPVSIDLYNAFKKAVPNGVMLNLYGASECAADGTFCDDVIHPFETRVPIGRPIDNTKIYILDEQMQPVPIGMSGEIYVSGDCVALGYYNRPDLTAERFLQDPFSGVDGMMMFRTGDFGRYLANSQIEYLGRSDSQVKIRGIRIELSEIESILNKHPLVKQSMVLVKKDRLGDKALAAYLKVEAEGLDQPSSTWRSHLLDHLPNYMVPPYFVSMLEYPHTPNGKINRVALPDPVQAMAERQAAQSDKQADAPRDEVDEKMLAIWKEILEIDQVNLNDDFFDLGGQSVLAVRLFKQISDQMGVDLDLSVMFENATPKQLADLSKSYLANDERPEFQYLVKINSGNDAALPKFFCIHGAGGNVLFLQEWIKYLGDIPFYAFKSAGVDGSVDLPQSVEEVAANYIVELRQIQPDGPYLLGGYSVGGIIAIEMAQQLIAAEQEVGQLILFDTMHPHVISRRLSMREHLRKINTNGIGYIRSAFANRLVEPTQAENQKKRINSFVERGERLPIDLRESFLYSYFERMESEYNPTLYSEPVTMFRAKEVWDVYQHVADNGDWGDLLPNLVVKWAEGDHFSVMNDPGLEPLISQLKETLY